MPLVRVSIREGQSPAFRAAVGDGIHRAMVAAIDVPPDDRFQIFSEHRQDELIYDPAYLGIARGNGFLVIQITLNAGRTLEKKRALYRAIAENLAADPGVRPEDILVTLTEVPKENWSFGKGAASYAEPSPPLAPGTCLRRARRRHRRAARPEGSTARLVPCVRFGSRSGRLLLPFGQETPPAASVATTEFGHATSLSQERS